MSSQLLMLLLLSLGLLLVVLVFITTSAHVCCVSFHLPSLSPLGDVVLEEGRKGWKIGMGRCYLLDLGVEINLIVEPAIVLSSSLLGTVEGFPQVFGR